MNARRVWIALFIVLAILLPILQIGQNVVYRSNTAIQVWPSGIDHMQQQARVAAPDKVSVSPMRD